MVWKSLPERQVVVNICLVFMQNGDLQFPPSSNPRGIKEITAFYPLPVGLCTEQGTISLHTGKPQVSPSKTD